MVLLSKPEQGMQEDQNTVQSQNSESNEKGDIMNIMEKLKARATGMERMRNEPMSLSLDESITGEFKPYTLDRNKEYSMELRVGVTFWANDVQYEEARKAALKMLIHELHSDILHQVAGLRSALYSQDDCAAQEIMSKMLKTLGL